MLDEKVVIKKINFDVKGDDRGSLIALESSRNIPFIINRIYYIFDTKNGISRGFHAHKSLKQVITCLKGECKLIVDDGKERSEIWLNLPNEGILIEGLIWREMHSFSKDCILLVLASEYYDENDYIRNYEEFIKECKNELHP